MNTLERINNALEAIKISETNDAELSALLKRL